MVLQITPWERAALQQLANGKAMAEMAGGLGLSEYEIEERLTALFAKMGSSTKTDAVDAAFRRGLLTPLRPARSSGSPHTAIQ